MLRRSARSNDSVSRGSLSTTDATEVVSATLSTAVVVDPDDGSVVVDPELVGNTTVFTTVPTMVIVATCPTSKTT